MREIENSGERQSGRPFTLPWKGRCPAINSDAGRMSCISSRRSPWFYGFQRGLISSDKVRLYDFLLLSLKKIFPSLLSTVPVILFLIMKIANQTDEPLSNERRTHHENRTKRTYRQTPGNRRKITNHPIRRRKTRTPLLRPPIRLRLCPHTKKRRHVLQLPLQRPQNHALLLKQNLRHIRADHGRSPKKYTRNPGQMLMYGKEASNRKQEIDRQHYTIPNQRPKDKHCGKI